MRYDFKNLKLEINNNTGTLYKNDKLLFRGDSYISIKMFLAESNNNEWIRKKFRAQLEMREHCRWKKQDEQLKSDQKIKKIQEKVKLSK
tara:strand:- start:967 stop:1233 length:267 start_codon:yes stop_codon:yes gene_type:complete